jgi:hypothetical protein
VERPVHAKAVRQALINIEAAKSFVHFIAEQTNVLTLGDLQGLESLMAVTVDVEHGRYHAVPLLSALPMLELYTFVFLGDAGLGKTTLARAMSMLQCKARGLPYYIETNTPDSLRGVCVNGFFRPHIPVLLDEWRPTSKQSSGSGSPSAEMLDALKCLTSVADGATIKCRYSDVKFAPNMPRLVTANCRTMEDWLRAVSDEGSAEDRNAVLRRCLFVEVDRPLVPKKLQTAFKAEKGEELADLQAAALLEMGLSPSPAAFQPVQREDGKWKQMTALDETDMWGKFFEGRRRFQNL